MRHHLAHAAAAYFLSPYNECAILTVDGWGEDETLSVCQARETTLSTLALATLPNSIGEVYTRLTTRLGWGMDDAGKTMALAAYGVPNGHDVELFHLSNSADGTLCLDTSGALQYVESVPRRNPTEPLSQIHVNAAAVVQTGLEKIMIQLAEWAHDRTRSANLCLGGGVALNCVANQRVQRESPFTSVFVQPSSGDSGIPLGAALAVYYKLNPNATRHEFRHPYLGRSYGRDECVRALANLNAFEYPDPHQLTDTVARLLADGAVVGWFQGKSEFGPRALGNRSILADPRQSQMPARLNSAVKRRESFRPFAPSVLLEYASEYFDMDTESPFMLMAFPIRDSKRDVIPAVAHVNGTARVQTVARRDNNLFHELIERFGTLTGIPVLINTSFNVAGEPIVESPDDAVRCFVNTAIDALAMGSFVVTKATCQSTSGGK